MAIRTVQRRGSGGKD